MKCLVSVCLAVGKKGTNLTRLLFGFLLTLFHRDVMNNFVQIKKI